MTQGTRNNERSISNSTPGRTRVPGPTTHASLHSCIIKTRNEYTKTLNHSQRAHVTIYFAPITHECVYCNAYDSVCSSALMLKDAGLKYLCLGYLAGLCVYAKE